MVLKRRMRSLIGRTVNFPIPSGIGPCGPGFQKFFSRRRFVRIPRGAAIQIFPAYPPLPPNSTFSPFSFTSPNCTVRCGERKGEQKKKKKKNGGGKEEGFGIGPLIGAIRLMYVPRNFAFSRRVFVMRVFSSDRVSLRDWRNSAMSVLSSRASFLLPHTPTSQSSA